MRTPTNGHAQKVKNVLGTELQPCGFDPKTGFYRDGYCNTGPNDHGVHVVCAKVTDEFLQFSKAKGNDLSTPIPDYNFPGLKEGDCWCLCAARWLEAYQAGKAPGVILEATHENTLEVIPIKALREHKISL